MWVQSARDLGLIVRDRRRALGLAQHTLAEQVGCSRQWIIALEQGKHSAELDLVLRTLTALGLRAFVAPRSETRGSSVSEDVDIDALIDKARRP